MGRRCLGSDGSGLLYPSGRRPGATSYYLKPVREHFLLPSKSAALLSRSTLKDERAATWSNGSEHCGSWTIR